MKEKLDRYNQKMARRAAYNLDRLIRELNVDVKVLAKKYGCETNFIYQLINGHANIGTLTRKKLSIALGVDEYEFLIPEYAANVASKVVPVLNKAQCGSWTDFSDLDYPAGIAGEYIVAVTTDPNAFVVIAHGDSMIGGRINPGDYLLVEPNKSVENGNIVLAELGDEKTVKKFYQSDSQVILQPLNPNYDPIIISDQSDLEKLVVYRVSFIMSRT